MSNEILLTAKQQRKLDAAIQTLEAVFVDAIEQKHDGISMKKTKKCYRTMSSDNFEPTNCIGKQCMGWICSEHLNGCSFVLDAVISTMRNLGELKKQGKEDTDDNVLETPQGNETNKKGTDNGDDDKDSACDGQCEEGGSGGPTEDRKQDDPSRAIQKDTEETTEGEGQGYVDRGAEPDPLLGDTI
jgi:hypothetical protein